MQDLVPKEPEEGQRGTITIKFRCPSGKIFSRRFHSTHALQVIFLTIDIDTI